MTVYNHCPSVIILVIMGLEIDLVGRQVCTHVHYKHRARLSIPVPATL